MRVAMELGVKCGYAWLLLASCRCSGGGEDTSDPAPHVVPQGGAGLCGEACDALQHKLHPVGSEVPGCPEGDDIQLADGGVETCEDFCRYQHENGVAWGTDCIAHEVETCEEVETVCNR